MNHAPFHATKKDTKYFSFTKEPLQTKLTSKKGFKPGNHYPLSSPSTDNPRSYSLYRKYKKYQRKPTPNKASLSESRVGELEMLEFLRSCGMQQYHFLFTKNGIKDMETVMELKEENLNELCIPLGHRLKILKRLREYIIISRNKNSISDHEETKPSSKEPRSTSSIQKSHNSTKTYEDKSDEDPKLSLREKFFGKGFEEETRQPPVSNIEIPPEFQKFFCCVCNRNLANKTPIKAFSKEFCSEQCYQLLAKEVSVECLCGKTLPKNSANYHRGSWYCSKDCRLKEDSKKGAEESTKSPHSTIQEIHSFFNKNDQLFKVFNIKEYGGPKPEEVLRRKAKPYCPSPDILNVCRISVPPNDYSNESFEQDEGITGWD